MLALDRPVEGAGPFLVRSRQPACAAAERPPPRAMNEVWNLGPQPPSGGCRLNATILKRNLGNVPASAGYSKSKSKVDSRVIQCELLRAFSNL